MLKFHGHTFVDSALCSCCIADKKVVIDPTNTGRLRGKFRAQMTHRWNAIRTLTREIIMKQDLLALKSSGLMQVSAPAITLAGTKMDMFQRWFEMGLTKVVLGTDGSWMRPMLNAAYSQGTRFGQGNVNGQYEHILAVHREGALQALARVELLGIINAVLQQSIRVVSNGLLTDQTPMAIVREVWKVIDRVGRNRSKAMIELLTVRAHAEASLDVYEAAGVLDVGLIPEARIPTRVTATDAEVHDAPKKSKKKSRKAGAKGTGPGSRGSRVRPPSQRTIRRIRRAELQTARRLGENVNVRTAGDDDVCPVCEDISEAGPYTINRARSLIPAHPRCRCVFIPASDRRFASDATRDVGAARVNEYELGLASSGSLSFEDFNPHHKPGGSPEGGQFTSGTGEAEVDVDGDYTDEEKEQIREYQNGAGINGYLRSANDPDAYDFEKSIAKQQLNSPQMRKQMSALDSAIARGKLKNDTTLYRGVNRKLFKYGPAGSTFTDPAYVATTTDKGISSGFGDRVEIRVKRGTRALDVTKALGTGNRYTQREYMLGRGQKFRVVSNTPDLVVLEHLRRDVDDALAFVNDLVDYNPNHEPAGSPKGGQFAPSQGGEPGSAEEAQVPREGSKKRDVYETYLKHGREAAIARAKELGLAPGTAASWTSGWKRAGTPGAGGTPIDPVVRQATYTPRPAPPVSAPPISVSPTGSRRSPGVDIFGTSPNRDKITAGLDAIPKDHYEVLAKRGVRIEMSDTVESSKNGSVNGQYSWGYGNQDNIVKLADNTKFKEWKYKIVDPSGTTVHELGHAYDHASNWRRSAQISKYVDEDAKKMSATDREYAKYYFSNDKERYAELYRVAYSPGKTAFHMSIKKAQKIFARSIEKLKEIN